jgi:hypothetical protein
MRAPGDDQAREHLANLEQERKAVIAELKPLDPELPFDHILLEYAEAIVDNPKGYPVTLAYLAKHKPKRRWPRREQSPKE